MHTVPYLSSGLGAVPCCGKKEEFQQCGIDNCGEIFVSAVFALTGTIQEICLLFFGGLQERRWVLRYGVLMACFWWSCGL